METNKPITPSSARIRSTVIPGESAVRNKLVPERKTQANLANQIEAYKNDSGLSEADITDLVTTQVEKQMLRGITDPRRLKAMLNIPNLQTVNTAMRRVQNRWAITGSTRKKTMYKGELISRMGAVQLELWDLVDNEKTSVKERLSALKQIVELIKIESEIHGLKPVSGRVDVNIHNSASDTNVVMQQMARRTAVREVANDFKNLLEQNRIIDHDSL